jgi:hypothetical protein
MTKVVINFAVEKSVGGAASINIENIKVKTVHKEIKRICLHFSDFCIGSCLIYYIAFHNEIQFCGTTIVLPVLPRSLGKTEKSVSPKLTDYFIQGVIK